METNALTSQEEIYNKLNNIEALLSNPTPTYYKTDKAADFLSVTENALRVMAHRDQIKYIKKQGKLYFRLSDLIAWFETDDEQELSNTEHESAEDILTGSKQKRS